MCGVFWFIIWSIYITGCLDGCNSDMSRWGILAWGLLLELPLPRSFKYFLSLVHIHEVNLKTSYAKRQPSKSSFSLATCFLYGIAQDKNDGRSNGIKSLLLLSIFVSRGFERGRRRQKRLLQSGVECRAKTEESRSISKSMLIFQWKVFLSKIGYVWFWIILARTF